jgi:hypothetical protein
VNVRVALAIGLTLVAIAVALVLSSSPVRIVATNGVPVRAVVASTHGPASVCQHGEALPAGTSGLRLSLGTALGPRVTVEAIAAGRVLSSGTRGSGWAGGDVTVPVEPVRHAAADVTVCVTLGHSREMLSVLGQRSRRARRAPSTTGRPRWRMRIEYLATGRGSWWSQILPVARRIGLGRAPSGTWIVLVLAALMATVTMLASRLCMRELGVSTGKGASMDAGTLRRVPRAAWICALIACLNAASWSILSPPFQTPDEPAHFAYVQQLAEAHRLPVGSAEAYSAEEQTALADLHHDDIQFIPGAKTISSAAQEHKLEHALSQPLSRRGPGDVGDASDEPPLFYALETIPYELGSSGSLLDRLQLMRLLCALFGGLTAFFVFLFVREALPRVPWAWTVGGLGAALAPLLAFMSGAVNPDALLATVSAALFYLLARAFRRGLAPLLAIAIGATIAIGFLTKLNFVGLAPGAILGLILLAARAPSGARRAACLALAGALALAAGPALLYLVLRPFANQGSLSFVSRSASEAQHASVLSEIGYIWQLYLPRLPGTTDYFPGVFPPLRLWFDGLIGLYGWADTTFAGWVCDIALIPAGLLAVLCLRALVARRAALRGRVAEILVYAAMALGLLVLVGAISYHAGVVHGEGGFWEPRYLLPLLPLLAGALALAARGAGRRWGPTAGVAIVVLFLAHDLFSQLLVISRYYG